MRVKVPLSPILNEFIDPLTPLEEPRSRQYRTRLAESRFSHDGFALHSVVTDDTASEETLFPAVSERVVRLPPVSATYRIVAVLAENHQAIKENVLKYIIW